MRTAAANLRRLGHILRVLLAHGAAHALGPRLARWPALARRLPPGDLPGPQRLAALLEDLGGTFIKFGQMLALQPDILSLEYCRALFNLLDRVAPFTYAEVRRVVTEELGRPPEEIFDSFDPAPLATASVGQVHVAYLQGEKVAVKVQRPRVEVEFASDIRLMLTIMAAIRWLHLSPLYWLLEPITEFVGWTREELDYRYEARYSERLRLLAESNPIQRVPKVLAEYTTRRTLVAEFLEGPTLLDYLRARERGDEVLQRRLASRGFDARSFAANVIDNFLGDAFRNGLYHADLHPANLVILPDNVVGYIDFGITGVLSPYSRRHLVAMTLALAQGDIETIHSQFLRLSVYGSDSDVEGFQVRLRALSTDWYEHDGKHKRLRVNFTRVMTDMLELSKRTQIMPERDIIKYIRSAIAIDGLNLRFAPDFEVGRHLEQACGRFLQWESVRGALSDDALMSWSGLGLRLLTETPLQTESLLGRLTRGELAVRAHRHGRSDLGDVRRARAVELAGMIFTLAVLMVLTGQPAVVGLNVFTVGSVLILGGLGRLLPALRRLV